MWLCFPLQTHLPPPLAHPALHRPVFRLLLKPTSLRAFALTTPSAQDTLSLEPMAPTVHSVTPQSGLPDPPLKTAHPPPPRYPRTFLHLSPRVLFSPRLLSLQLSVSLLSVSLEKVKPTRAGLWSVLFTTVFPGLDQCPGQRQSSAGIREMNENCQVGQVPLSFLPHPFLALVGSQGIL